MRIAPGADEKRLSARLTAEFTDKKDHLPPKATALLFGSHGEVFDLEHTVSFVREHTHRTKIGDRIVVCVQRKQTSTMIFRELISSIVEFLADHLMEPAEIINRAISTSTT